MFQRSRIDRRILLAALLSWIALPAFAITLPSGFSDHLVATVSAPTALAFTPDGRLLITSQGGTLRIVQGGALLPAAALDLTAKVCSNSERGLLGVAVDPSFTTNHFVYLFYTFNKNAAGCPTGSQTSPVERVSRFTLDVPTPNVIDPATETILIDNVLNFGGNHNGGDVKFGGDGYLYASIGDGGTDYAGDSGGGGANDASRDRNILNGKVLRIVKDGTLPPDNPFLGAGTARCNMGPVLPGVICQEAYLWGLRNPFRFAFQPGTGRLHVNDVGQSSFEEIDLGQSGADYGWPCREGAHTALTTGKCNPTPPAVVDPIFDYPRTTIPGTTASGCGSITGGVFVPAGAWPGYDGSYLFADFNCGAILRLNFSSGPVTAADFATGAGASVLVHLEFGPSAAGQSLYYTTYAGGGQVRRVDAPSQTPVAATLTTVTPCRIVDTRGAAGPTGGPALAASGSRNFPLTGAPCGIPMTATAVAANVTVTNATASGSLRISFAGMTPTLETIDFRPGQTRANNAILGLFGTPAGTVTVTSGFAAGTADLVIDVTGYWQ